VSPFRLSRHVNTRKSWQRQCSRSSSLLSCRRLVIQFDWVSYRWIAGTVLAVSSSPLMLWLDFWSIWPAGPSCPGECVEKTLENKLYHGASLPGEAAEIPGRVKPGPFPPPLEPRRDFHIPIATCWRHHPTDSEAACEPKSCSAPSTKRRPGLPTYPRPSQR
jgi:hypothetical protein